MRSLMVDDRRGLCSVRPHASLVVLLLAGFDYCNTGGVSFGVYPLPLGAGERMFGVPAGWDQARCCNIEEVDQPTHLCTFLDLVLPYVIWIHVCHLCYLCDFMTRGPECPF